MRSFDIRITCLVSIMVMCIQLLFSQKDSKTMELKLELPKSQGRDRVKILSDLCNTYLSSDLELSRKYGEQGLQLSRKIFDTKGEILLLLRLGMASSYAGQFELSFEKYRRGLFLLDSIQSELYKDLFYLNMGTDYLTMGALDSALYYFDRTVIWAKKKGHENQEAGALLNIYITYKEKGELTKSLDYLDQALRIAQHSNDKVLQVLCFEKRGNLYLEMKEVQNGLTSFLSGLEISKESKNKRTSAGLLDPISYCYFLLGDTTKAIELRKESIQLYSELQDLSGESIALNDLVLYIEGAGDYDEMEKLLLRALELSEKSGDLAILLRTHNNLGEFYQQDEKYEKSLFHYMEVLKLTDSSDINTPMKDLYSGISELQFSLGNHELAYKYQKKYIVIKDSLMSSEIKKQIIEVETSYKLREVEDRNQQLKQENAFEKQKGYYQKAVIYGIIITFSFILTAFILFYLYKQQKNKREVVQLEQKLLQMQINPHFIFNSLNSVQHFFLEGKVVEGNRYLTNFGQFLRLTLDNSRENLVSLESELSSIKSYMEIQKLQLEYGLDYTIKVGEKVDKMYLKVPPLILQPFIENAIIHGVIPNKRSGKITVDIVKQEKEIHMVIKDNGVGIATEGFAKIDRGTSQGISITKDRIQLLWRRKRSKKVVSISRIEAGGTQVQIKIPELYG